MTMIQPLARSFFTTTTTCAALAMTSFALTTSTLADTTPATNRNYFEEFKRHFSEASPVKPEMFTTNEVWEGSCAAADKPTYLMQSLLGVQLLYPGDDIIPARIKYNAFRGNAAYQPDFSDMWSELADDPDASVNVAGDLVMSLAYGTRRLRQKEINSKLYYFFTFQCSATHNCYWDNRQFNAGQEVAQCYFAKKIYPSAE